jgi:hypothetical protein
MTTTLALEGEVILLANNGTRLWITIGSAPAVEGQRGGDGDGSNPADEHQGDQDDLSSGRQVRGNASG